MGRKLTLLVAAVAGLVTQVNAQTVGTPVFMAPYRAFTKSEFSATFSDPGAGWALEGAYRYGSGKLDIGFRGGFWSVDSDANDDLRFLAGAEVRVRVIEHTENFPLDGAFTAGVGGAFGDNSVGFIPLGLSLGRRIELEDSDVSFVPYLQPVIGFTFGDNSDAIFALGLGVDFKLSSRFDLRVTGGIGDIDGIGIGFAWVH
jgi:opacity protein-like surface antigen